MATSDDCPVCATKPVLYTEESVANLDPNYKLNTSRLKTTVQSGKVPVVVLSFGSFSPVTLMHLRIMEDAKDALNKLDNFEVIGGFLSPVHAKYGKKTLAPMQDRLNMTTLALEDSSWLVCSPWECAQDKWTVTAQAMKYFTTELSNVKITQGDNAPEAGLIRVLLVCGGDLLASFVHKKKDGTPVWAEADIKTILQDNGVLCIRREGVDIEQAIKVHSLLFNNSKNIILVDPEFSNSISSTSIRLKLNQGRSIKYLVPEAARTYIEDNNLKDLPQWLVSKPPSFPVRVGAKRVNDGDEEDNDNQTEKKPNCAE